jgi:hypothetical protein
MDGADLLDAYLGDLKRALRGPRRKRGRILLEIRAHLLDAAEAEPSWRTDEGLATERAILRFGPAAETARQFNRCAGAKPLRRAIAPLIAALAVTSTATATVWAFSPGSGAPRSRRAPSHLLAPRRPAAPLREASRSKPAARRKSPADGR